MSYETLIGNTAITAPVVANASTAGYNITTSTVRPYTLTNMGVNTGLQITAVERKLQIEATLDDVFIDVGADVVFNGKKVSVSDAIVTRLKAIDKGSRSQIIPIVRPLAGPGVGGTAEDMMGSERSQVLKYMKVYYNEYAQGMMGEEWGLNYNDVQVFGLYSQIQPALSKWFKEDTGRQYREALLQRWAWPLQKTGVAKTAAWNPNWCVPNTETGSQPAYDTTLNTFTDQIGTALAAADTGTAGINAGIDLDFLLYLDYYAANVLKIEPVMIGGKKSYLLLLPSPQYYSLLKVTNGQLGSVWQNVTQLSSEEQNFPGIIGRVKSLVICEDQRYPTIEWATNYASHSVTIEYCEPGNDDNRNKSIYNSTSNMAWDIAFLCGANAIVDWEYTPLHFEIEKTEYGKRYGKAAFTERGIQLGATYDVDTETDTSIQNFGSIVIPLAATSLVNVS
jgi:hypothetical protein